jgi:hypothetical protein
MKRTLMVAACLPVLVLCGWFLSPGVGAAPSPAGGAEVDIDALKAQLNAQKTALRDFKYLIERLAGDRDDSGNSDRRDDIEELKDAMKSYILKLERKLGKTHTIIQHLEEPEAYEERDEPFEDPVYNSGAMENAIETGGANADPELYRLARFQQIYLTCDRIEVEAVNGTNWAFNQYYKQVIQFAGLMNAEVKATREQLEAATTKADLMD